jgi:hypothetical protein
VIYFEGQVLKFAHPLVGKGDPERGASLVLFSRVFGDRQSPDSGPAVDRSARPLGPVPNDDETTQSRLWQRFREFVDNPKLAAQYGVRVAQTEAPAARMKPGQIWELELDAAGGLNLRKLSEQRSAHGPDALKPT